MKSIAAQAAIAAMRPLDRQRGRLTGFELGYLRKFPQFFDAGKPLDHDGATTWVAFIASHLNIRAPEIRETKRRDPWCMPWGKRPTIYLRADHRQPYLLAHECAHAAARSTKHGPAFLENYVTALASLGSPEAAIRGAMRTHGIHI